MIRKLFRALLTLAALVLLAGAITFLYIAWRVNQTGLADRAQHADAIVVLGARDVGAMVILATAFTFIGLGGSTEWGMLLVAGRDYVIGAGGNPLTYWWVFVPTTLALILFGIGWNLLGDGLNTVLDPRITG